MDKSKNLVLNLKEFKKRVNDEIPINKMLLFGSQTKGKTHKWSDVDLIVVSKAFKGKRSFKRANKLYDFWTIDSPVDFLCYTPQEFNRLKKHSIIVREAVREGIKI
ncbi:nucleotidyltransferase domain-containing protein [Candidatus Woesearchaeota archaeon]|nr:nucleotidyltransferase domain-containing protein [Candidatus Woesearchaeota archaeon]